MSSQKKSVFSVLQRVGQSLMLPVSTLPAAGLLVALGRMIEHVSANSPKLKVLSDLFFHGGLAIFEQLPVIFAVGVAIGFTSGAGTAALAAVASYFTLTNVLTVMTAALGLSLKIDTGVFGGILIGLMSALLYNRYQNTQLNPIFGFFSGKRLVPILSVAAAIVLGAALSFLWPPVQSQIKNFGEWIMGSPMGPAFYAAGKRLLIPLGLHHVFYPPFLYQFGEFVTSSGQVVKGEAARYFAGDPSAGRFMAAEYPIMLFGLPAAAFAMFLRASPAKRKAVGGVMLAAALTSIITGITEPIEFSFIFVAPILYVCHVLLAFLSGFLTAQLDVHLGYTFSASLIDWFLGYFNQKNTMWLFVAIGPAIAALYFTIFYTLIGVFQYKTPGREDDSAEDDTAAPVAASEKAAHVLAALGGAKNIQAIDACITRLRLEVRDTGIVNEAKLKKLGAAGVMKAGNSGVQVVFGVQSDQLKEQIKVLLHRPANFFAPLEGELVAIEKVPDATFSQKLMGDGFAILPSKGLVQAPCDAEVVNLFATNHAIGLLAKDGSEILIHVGLDTVKMKGDGFQSFVKVGDKVKRGQKLLEFSLERIKNAGYSPLTPVVITNSDQFDIDVQVQMAQKIAIGSALAETHQK